MSPLHAPLVEGAALEDVGGAVVLVLGSSRGSAPWTVLRQSVQTPYGQSLDELTQR